VSESQKKASSLRPKVLSFLVFWIARIIASTLRIRYKNLEKIDQITSEHNGGIIVTWHGRTLIPAYVLRGKGLWALISLSNDGEVQNRIFRRFGFQTIRGSTGRGGVKAALMLAKKVNEGGVLAFTPDGPRGPTKKVQEGTIFLAQRSGRPIIPLGVSANPRKLLGSWDSYMIPHLFARGSFVIGDPIFVPLNATDSEKAAIALQVEAAINQAEAEADSLVGLPKSP